jgi:polysaccharide biosynthesis transport protein
LAGWKSLEEILLLDPRSGLRFLPAGAKPNMPHTNELLASDAMKKLIALLQETYDYLIIGGGAAFLTSYKGRARNCRGVPPK